MQKMIGNKTNASDMKRIRALFMNVSSDPAALPVSYRHDGVLYRGMPADSKVARQFIDTNIVLTTYTATAGSGLDIKAECLEYRDFPVYEWTVYFSNAGLADTYLLSDVAAANCFLPGEAAVLTSNNGDYYSYDGYTETRTPLPDSAVFRQSPTQGRSCNEAFPYQRLMFDGFGLSIAIGWPGEWFTEYSGQAGGVAFKAGQKVTHTVIRPGETFRTPRMTVMAFNGDATRGINLWRRWFVAHVLPRQYGQPLAGKQVGYEPGGGIEFCEATTENQLAALDIIKKLGRVGIDLWWIDAGWYPCYMEPDRKEWPFTGTWEPDRAHFPDGLGPVGEKCGELGIDFLVWHEPERVKPGTDLALNHPEWMLKRADPGIVGHSPNDAGPDMMLNLGDPDCLKWACEHFDKLIKEGGIKCYRQDCNFALVGHWRDNETPDRAGMVENKYVQGYLAYWDYLLLNNPDLFIDSCSSGGRRNDLETLRRAVPLHHTDYGYGNHVLNQAFHYSLNSWIPYYRGFKLSWDDESGSYEHPENQVPGREYDNYAMTTSVAPAINVGNPAELAAKPDLLPYLEKMYAIWEKASPLMIHGDFYALTPNHRDSTKWTVFQFDDPDCQIGFLKVIRHNRCEQVSITVNPFMFQDGLEYTFENDETGESFIMPGEKINAEGLIFSQPMRSGAIWFYKTSDC